MKEQDVQGVPGAEPPVGLSAASPQPSASGLSAPIPHAEDDEPDAPHYKPSICCEAPVKDVWDERCGWVCCECTACGLQYQDERVPYYHLVCTNSGEWIITMLDAVILHRGDKAQAMILWRALRSAYKADPLWAAQALKETMPKMVPVIDIGRVRAEAESPQPASGEDLQPQTDGEAGTPNTSL